MRPLVVAPAHVHAHPLPRHVAQGVIRHFDMAGREPLEFLERLIAVHGVASHREVRRIDLQEDARRNNRLVLSLQRAGERRQVIVLRTVKVVGLKERHHPRGGGVHESLRRSGLPNRGAEVVQVRLEGTGILHGDRAHAARPAILRGRTALGELAQQPWELDEILIWLISPSLTTSIPSATCRRTTSATAAAITASPSPGACTHAFAAAPASARWRANSTSTTAWLRGRLPTCVVRIRSVLRCIPDGVLQR